jgi:hypothetical protein
VKHVTAPLHVGASFWVYFGLQTLLIAPVVLILCGAFFLLLERPCMDREWPSKFAQCWKSRLGLGAATPTVDHVIEETAANV